MNPKLRTAILVGIGVTLLSGYIIFYDQSTLPGYAYGLPISWRTTEGFPWEFMPTALYFMIDVVFWSGITYIVLRRRDSIIL